MRTLIVIIILFALQTSGVLHAQEKLTENIRLNQVGFYPDRNKIAVIVDGPYEQFFISTPDLKKKVYEGKLTASRKSYFSDKKTRIADFSDFTTPGTYVIIIPGLGYSYAFEIKDHVHEALVKASLKGFYFQRFSTSLPEQFAGKWNRPISHPDNKVIIHPSAASDKRPEGTIISAPRGWIDAGDYNKYIVNSGITMGTLFSAYEDFPDYYKKLNLNIPESTNEIPDLLDEALWNLRWMLTMQDPNDGGVYHKCTNALFDKMVMPHAATSPRYAVQKGTAAALDFAATTAQAARIFKRFEKELPGLADSCLSASKKAWSWAKKNPQLPYDQNKNNIAFDPDVKTGEYGDKYFTDEFIWAAAELLATTGDEAFLNEVNFIPDSLMLLPSWSQVRLLGYYTLIRSENQLPEKVQSLVLQLKSKIVKFADELIAGVDNRSYMTVMGSSTKDFVWGSNSVAGNQGIALLQAYRISGDKKYLNYAISNLDYLLGRNATGYSFLTGFGDKPTMHPHHRPSEADGIVDPIPGLLAGGPNPGMQDKCSYPSSIADEAYTDDVCSYASNEIAINWNAPLVYLAGGIEAFAE